MGERAFVLEAHYTTHIKEQRNMNSEVRLGACLQIEIGKVQRKKSRLEKDVLSYVKKELNHY